MQQPKEFVDSQHPNYVCKLVKAFYVLKQTPQAWFPKLSASLHSWKFVDSKSDSSLFVYTQGGIIIYILIYIDNIIVTSNNSSKLKAFVNQLHSSFALNDL